MEPNKQESEDKYPRMKKIQLIETSVKDPGGLSSISADLDLSYKSLTGIAVLTGIGQGHSLSSSSVEGKELFPKNFELAFIQSGEHVAPKDRFFPLEKIPASGRKIQLEYKDAGTAPSYPYNLKIYLLLEN